MTIESAIIDLTTQTNALLSSSTTIQANVNTSIASAVATSVNATQIPLAVTAKNLIDTQTLLVKYIARG